LSGWVFFTLFQTVAEIETAIYAALMMAVSWPVYRFIIRNKKRKI